MTRDEHLAWCQQRALKYLDRGEFVDAAASFASDMRLEPETREYLESPAIAMLFLMEANVSVQTADPGPLRRFIEGCR